MSGPRSPCPVLTCTRDMPSGQVMCTVCWGEVPTSLRRTIDNTGDASAFRPSLVRQAIAAAQDTPS